MDPETFLDGRSDVENHKNKVALKGFKGLWETIERKEKKIFKEGRERFPCILVVELVDLPLKDLLPHLDKVLCSDLRSSRFSEVWLADYTAIPDGMFDDVELFCLSPCRWWGYHPREPRKPYG